MSDMKTNKPRSRVWKAELPIFIGVLLYLVDCLVAHQFHPQVAWLESGVYMGGLGGFYVTAIVLVAGIYSLLQALLRK